MAAVSAAAALFDFLRFALTCARGMLPSGMFPAVCIYTVCVCACARVHVLSVHFRQLSLVTHTKRAFEIYHHTVPAGLCLAIAGGSFGLSAAAGAVDRICV